MTQLQVEHDIDFEEAHVTPLEGGSLVGGHGDVFSGGSPWTVTGPLHDLHVLLGFFSFIH
jgi:hypothetical protein